jgi:hypothetical protein
MEMFVSTFEKATFKPFNASRKYIYKFTESLVIIPRVLNPHNF